MQFHDTYWNEKELHIENFLREEYPDFERLSDRIKKIKSMCSDNMLHTVAEIFAKGGDSKMSILLTK